LESTLTIAVGFNQRKKMLYKSALATFRKTNVAKADSCDTLNPSAKADSNLLFSAKLLKLSGF